MEKTQQWIVLYSDALFARRAEQCICDYIMVEQNNIFQSAKAAIQLKQTRILK